MAKEEQLKDIETVKRIIGELKDMPEERIRHILKTVAVWYSVED